MGNLYVVYIYVVYMLYGGTGPAPSARKYGSMLILPLVSKVHYRGPSNLRATRKFLQRKASETLS